MRIPIEGGCICGAVRYRLTRPPLALYACHCTDCQRHSGTAFGMSIQELPEVIQARQERVSRPKRIG